MVELRSCTHLHFIRALKGGLVIKNLNVVHGKPSLKFKNVKEAYETGGTRNYVPLSAFSPKIEIEDLQSESNSGRAERTCMPVGERTSIKSESGTSEYAYRNGDEERESDSDDISFGAMTLRQIKDRCKTKKRKCSIYPGEENNEACTPGKQDHPHSLPEEDEYDLMEPLINLRSRTLEKTKRKCTRKSTSIFQNALSRVKSEDIASDQVVFQSIGDFTVPIDIKFEVSEPIHSECYDMIVTAIGSSSGFDMSAASSGVVSSEELERANKSVSETGMLMVLNEENETRKDQVLESGIPTTSCEEEPETAQDFALESGMTTPSNEEHETDNLLENGMPTMSSEKPETDYLLENRRTTTSEEPGSENQMPTFFAKEQQCCILNEQPYEFMDEDDPKSIPGGRSSGGGMTVDVARLISHQFSDLSLSNLKNEVTIMDPYPSHVSPEKLSPSKDHRSHMHFDSQKLPGIHEVLWMTGSNRQFQVPDITIGNSLQGVEISNRQGSRFSVDSVKDDGSHLTANAEEKSQVSACPDAAGNCSGVIHSFVDEPVAVAQVEDNKSDSKLRDPPQRLFSVRKAISPTSQRRLCKAMESTELDDEQYYKYTRKLCYMKQTEDSISRLERTNQIRTAEVTISPEKIFRNSKNEKSSAYNKGILKIPRLSHGIARFATGCPSVQSCSESAISFSQQQMHDIESIASKLTRELKSMKDIVEEALHSTSCSAMSFRYSACEMRIAIGRATRVEESAKKWLSIMARDCNRFCKIMKLTEKGSATSGSMASKEKRRIAFADEAGGKLCDVKTFENDMASSMDSESEGTEIVNSSKG